MAVYQLCGDAAPPPPTHPGRGGPWRPPPTPPRQPRKPRAEQPSNEPAGGQKTLDGQTTGSGGDDAASPVRPQPVAAGMLSEVDLPREAADSVGLSAAEGGGGSELAVGAGVGAAENQAAAVGATAASTAGGGAVQPEAVPSRAATAAGTGPGSCEPSGPISERPSCPIAPPAAQGMPLVLEAGEGVPLADSGTANATHRMTSSLLSTACACFASRECA